MTTPQNSHEPLPSMPSGSVSWLIGAAEQQSNAEFTVLCREYFPRLRALAERTLGALPGANFEADDVVQSALRTFCDQTQRKSPEAPVSLDGAWGLLCRIVVCKSRRRHSRQAFGKPGARLNPFSDLSAADSVDGPERSLIDESTDEFDAMLAETLEELDDSLRPVALLMLENWSNQEMAEKLDCSVRTVNRKISLVRQSFETHLLK